MSDLDYAQTLSYLMGRIGDRVVVKVASVTADGPPLVMEACGVLAAGWSPATGYADVDDVVRFGFDEHDTAFFVDREFFRRARTDATGEWLAVDLTTVGVEVTSSPDR